MPMPAVSLAAVPGKRLRALEMAGEIERRGFSGIYCPSLGDALGLCTSLAHVTSTIRFGTAIEPIYFRHPSSMAQTASYIHEVSGGRFDLGLGVSHGPVHERLQLDVGRPLSDMRDYVASMRAAGERIGELPPIVLATLRDRMVALAAEVGDGAVWANGSRSHMPESLKLIPDARRAQGFFVGNMIPTVIDDDREAAAAVNRRTLTGYVALPNYRNYWKAAGYVEEMEAIEKAFAAGERDKVPTLMSERWLSDCTLYGSATEVRDGVEAWFDAGVTTPIVVMSSTKGGQFVAIEQLFAAYS
ncbi:MAG TPA: LLM class flavin-dependent oxidoreductase [Acidimicrobiales bacterium]|nr:LLM class flavin-dependent oxidoreductase [Acidimicrobiales bacterium]